jgi:uncharacterized protein (TIRG00374 family)
MNRIFSIAGSNSSSVKRLLRLLLIIIPLAVAGNIFYVVYTTNPKILRNISEFDYRYFALAAIIALFPWLGQTFRIFIWGRVFGVGIKPSQAYKTVLASDLGAAITPTILGGSYAKLGFLIRYGFSSAEAALVTFIGSLVDGVFFAIALPIAIIWSRAWENPHIMAILNNLVSHWPIAALVLAAFVVLLIVINRIRPKKEFYDPSVEDAGNGLLSRITLRIHKFKNDFAAASRFVAKNGKGEFIVCVFLSGLGWCGRYGAISALVAGLGFPVDPVLFFLLQWVVFTAMTMIPTPGAIGGAEVSFALIHNGLISSAFIPLATVVWRFVTFYMIIGLGALIFAATQLRPRRQTSHQPRTLASEQTEVIK